jgi:hypothetical protein
VRGILLLSEFEQRIAGNVDDLDCVEQILARIALHYLSSDGLFANLQERGGWSASSLDARVAELRERLKDRPAVRELATKLLEDPSGGTIEIRRRHRPKPDQETLLHSYSLASIDE